MVIRICPIHRLVPDNNSRGFKRSTVTLGLLKENIMCNLLWWGMSFQLWEESYTTVLYIVQNNLTFYDTPCSHPSSRNVTQYLSWRTQEDPVADPSATQCDMRHTASSTPSQCMWSNNWRSRHTAQFGCSFSYEWALPYVSILLHRPRVLFQNPKHQACRAECVSRSEGFVIRLCAGLVFTKSTQAQKDMHTHGSVLLEESVATKGLWRNAKERQTRAKAKECCNAAKQELGRSIYGHRYCLQGMPSLYWISIATKMNLPPHPNSSYIVHNKISKLTAWLSASQTLFKSVCLGYQTDITEI